MNDYICISMSRYEELLRTKNEYDVLFRAYQNGPAYSLEAVAVAIFGQDNKYRPADQG